MSATDTAFGRALKLKIDATPCAANSPTGAGEPTKAQYKMGDNLVIAAPAHSGLPNGATAMVACSRHDASSSCWLYDVTLSGGGQNGSGVRFVRGVQEGWLRPEGRIATAKECAPRSFSEFVLSAPRLLVPLFQRRYCWTIKEWKKLWCDVYSPRGLGPHFVGRVVVCHEREALIVVDGQQRCTTMMLLLTALRDAAQEVADTATAATAIASSDASSSAEVAGAATTVANNAIKLCTELDRVVRTRVRLAPADSADRPATLGAEHAGLEGLDDAWSVRFVPSREDRRPFCSLVLRAPFDAAGSGGARKMSACYATFRAEIAAMLEAGERNAFEVVMPTAAVGGMGGEIDDVNMSGASGKRRASGTDEAMPSAWESIQDSRRLLQRYNALRRVAKNALERMSVVVFELQDGVAVQNMYDMLAQREKAFTGSMGFFSKDTGGRAMSEADLVRNLLLNHIADDGKRYAAYDNHWRCIERVHGDGDAAILESFLRAYSDARLAGACATGASAVHHAGAMGPPPSLPPLSATSAEPLQAQQPTTVCGACRRCMQSVKSPTLTAATPTALAPTASAAAPVTMAGAAASKRSEASQDGALLQAFAQILKSLGGNAGNASLYAAPDDTDRPVVDSTAACRAALMVLAELVAFVPPPGTRA
eukprot:CAMPEP_0183342242 /NCGR_PEP_ID=MMETSP0164_2-20130417/8387_1 /TAXON_ID=221442 /ORGANISM="Coccolithus pelagicus ssp braarudi, Strain PLY182g" /LENGTH=651 /DNA_ID=CAMNT_0025512769 /DNA_START=1 /DNA_END=1956 /DNA_ORIENTATION=+